MIVDDEQLALDTFERLLGRHGFRVFTALGARQALEIIRNEPAIEIVLSDIIMPGMDGTELVREIARVSPCTACVLMTAGGIERADVPDGVRLLRKPFRTGDLLTAIEQAVAATQLKLRAPEMGPAG